MYSYPYRQDSSARNAQFWPRDELPNAVINGALHLVNLGYLGSAISASRPVDLGLLFVTFRHTRLIG